MGWGQGAWWGRMLSSSHAARGAVQAGEQAALCLCLALPPLPERDLQPRGFADPPNPNISLGFLLWTGAGWAGGGLDCTRLPRLCWCYGCPLLLPWGRPTGLGQHERDLLSLEGLEMKGWWRTAGLYSPRGEMRGQQLNLLRGYIGPATHPRMVSLSIIWLVAGDIHPSIHASTH